ncbi:MAG: deoxyguanosinetriphosphate triphosphohydrolase [Candidatus Pelagibacterales bacterium]|tara:strand:+ start:51 stop:1190 length:1140 start_codon:yes stop_codon:yes gene_type:complete
MKNPLNLSAIAVKQGESKGRIFKENFSDTRSEYQRDRDRILHSAAFRRLKHKTQVFVSHEGDHYRTRLTHSLEVSQIARSICRVFGLNEDLAETLSIAHDIGHPPFGHAGEDALRSLMNEHEGFDHNDQAIRIVHLLEKKYFDFDGLNLTWETLEGLVKHNGPIEGNAPPTILKLSNEFDLELGEYSSLEAQIASISDDIAYNNHDIDDGLRAGFFTFNELRELPLIGNIVERLPRNFETRDIQRINNEITRRSTNLMISDIIINIKKNIELEQVTNLRQIRSLKKPIVNFSNEMKSNVESVRNFLSERMYSHESIIDMSKNAHQIVTFLYNFLINADHRTLNELKIDLNRDDSKNRIVCDFIAGMTDNYARTIYEKYS